MNKKKRTLFNALLLIIGLLTLGCATTNQKTEPSAAASFDYGPPPPNNYENIIWDKIKTDCVVSVQNYETTISQPYKFYNDNLPSISGWAIKVESKIAKKSGNSSAGYTMSGLVVFRKGEIVNWPSHLILKK